MRPWIIKDIYFGKKKLFDVASCNIAYSLLDMTCYVVTVEEITDDNSWNGKSSGKT